MANPVIKVFLMELLQVSSSLTSDLPSSLTTKVRNIKNGLIPEKKYTFHIKDSSLSDSRNNHSYPKIRTFLGFVNIGEKEYVEVERSPYRAYQLARKTLPFRVRM